MTMLTDLLSASFLDDLQVLEYALGRELDTLATLANGCELIIPFLFFTPLRLLRLDGYRGSFGCDSGSVFAFKRLGVLHMQASSTNAPSGMGARQDTPPGSASAPPRTPC